MSLTGIKDVDMNIILQLEDSDLPRVCAVNKYVNEICESDAFWYRRLINRITKVRDDNLSKYKKLIIIDVTGERIREMQRFFGYKSLKELNMFLNELPPNAVYLLYYEFQYLDGLITETYDFNPENIPAYINRVELQYDLRREVAKSPYLANTTRRIPYVTFRFELRPRGKRLKVEIYDAYKSMGIIN